MPEYPPKLLSIEEAEFGSVLNLSDGRKVPISIRPPRLAEALAEQQSRTLTEMLDARSLTVFADVLLTSEEEWRTISNLIRTSQTAETILRQHPTVWSTFHEPYNAILVKPHRIYGGLQVNLYTSHPFHFRDDHNRPAPWRRALLNAPGGWLFEVWADLQACEVQVSAHLLQGHFVE